jgi:hypothetical protein
MSNPLQHQVQAIARRARRLLLVHGLCWFVVVVVSVAFVFGCVDYLLRLQDQGVRVILSLAFGLSLLWSLRRFVIPSMRHRFGDLEVAYQVEQRFPQLGDRLSSSLDFLRHDNAAHQTESACLRQTVIAETEALVRSLDLGDCLDSRATRRSLLVCLPLLVVICVICAINLDASSLAARRLAAPWTQHPWPRWNSLEIAQAPERIALGQDFAVEVTDAHGRLPKDATFHFWFDGDNQGEVETSVMQRGDDRFHYTRRNVTQAFQYRVTGGDDDSMNWRPLEVVEPARVVDFQVAMQPPSYSGITSGKLSSGPIRVLADSQLAMSGRTSRPVKEVRFHIQVGEVVESVNAAVNSTDSTFSIASLPTDAPAKGQYWIELIEADGVVSGSDSRANWEIVPDHTPSVAVLAPTTEMYFTPDAKIPLRVTATDDLAIKTLQLQVGTTTVPLFLGPEIPTARDSLPAQSDLRDVSRTLDLSEFQLAPGDALELAFVASDYKPQTSDSLTRTITIISRDDFDYRSQERQKQLLAKLIEALRLQRATRSQVESLQTQLKSVGKLSDADASQLRAGEHQQQQVARLLDNSSGGAAQLAVELLASMDSNQMSGSDVAQRMERLSAMLEVINRQRLPELQSEFVRATKATRVELDGVDEIASLLVSIGNRQNAIANDLQAMIDQLSQWDDYRRFARDVAQLLRDQQELSTKVTSFPTIGQRLDTLSPQQRADLERASGEQLDAARRLERIQAEMDRLRETILGTDPAVAATLAEAAREAGTRGIAERMREVGNDVARNRLGNASQAQSEIEQGLQQVLSALTDSQSRTPRDMSQQNAQQLATALEQLKIQLTSITTRQQTLLDETSQWRGSGTSLLRPAEMAPAQQQLANETKAAREQLPIPKAFEFGMKSVEAIMGETTEQLKLHTPDERVERLQNRSLSRLQQLLAALTSPTAPDDGTAANQGTPNGGDDPNAASSADQKPSLSVEELRLLHTMQIDIYERTVALEKQRQEGAVLADEDKQELQRLATEQGELAELLIGALTPRENREPTKPAIDRQRIE